MEILQACLTEALKFILLAGIAGLGYLSRKYLIPILTNMRTNLQTTSETLGIQLTNEQLTTARSLLKDLVSSAYRLKLGGKIEDAKEYVNYLAKTKLEKLGICLDSELLDELRRAALAELEQTLQEVNEQTSDN